MTGLVIVCVLLILIIFAVERVTKSALNLGIPIVTPRIGETIQLNGAKITVDNDWWKNIE